MANSIEPTVGLVNQNFVGPTSRYLNSEIINYVTEGKKYLTFKTWKRPTRLPSQNDRYYVITAGTQYRPDIVSRNAYGKEGYWWLIMTANNMIDVLEFKAGTTILIPTPYM